MVYSVLLPIPYTWYTQVCMHTVHYTNTLCNGTLHACCCVVQCINTLLKGTISGCITLRMGCKYLLTHCYTVHCMLLHCIACCCAVYYTVYSILYPYVHRYVCMQYTNTTRSIACIRCVVQCITPCNRYSEVPS